MTAATLDLRCPGCFTAIPPAAACPRCGPADPAGGSALLMPRGTRLQNQFVVGRVLGKPGGFGITYLGWDRHLETRVAIKEYLPRDLAGRATDHVTVAAHSRDDAELFGYGLEQFLGEARTLAQLDHPNIVRVRQFFEANGTAYLVMDYYEGLSLAEHLERQGGRLPEDQAKALMLPILDGLRAVHAKGFLHRDIKPQNIYLARTEGGGARPILLDFGAARLAMGERSRSLSVVLTPGFAPFEQYHRKGNQGPWSDVYGAAAVLYRMVTGVAPPEATERMSGDELEPATVYGVSPALSQALAEGLALLPEARPQTVQTFQTLLAGVSQSAFGKSDGSTLQPLSQGPVVVPETAPVREQRPAHSDAQGMGKAIAPPLDTSSPFDSEGRFTRSSWFAWSSLFWVGAAIGYFIVGGPTPWSGWGVVAILIAIASFWIFSIRRLHDIGVSAWWSLCIIVPYVNILLLLILLTKKGYPSANRFGPPRPTRPWERFIAALWRILLIILVALSVFFIIIKQFELNSH